VSAQVRIGLVGAGRIGTLHATHLATRVPGAALVAIADVNYTAARELGAALGVESVYGDARDLIEDPSVEAVVICSSTDTHAELIEAVARAGKHVFCEKPIDHDLARIDRVLATVKKSGVKFQVGFNRRFDASFSRARALVAEGRIGEPHILRITSRDPEPPPIEYVKVSGGIFMDMTIHDFDMARFLIGAQVNEIYAIGGVLIDPRIGEVGDIDTAVIALQFENGVIGTIDNSRKAVYGYDQRVEIFGSEGVIIVSNRRPDEVVVTDGTGAHGAQPLYFFIERYTPAYIEEMSAFVDAVRNDSEPAVTGVDGREPVVMAHAALKSYREHRPVSLDEVDLRRADSAAR